MPTPQDFLKFYKLLGYIMIEVRRRKAGNDLKAKRGKFFRPSEKYFQTGIKGWG